MVLALRFSALPGAIVMRTAAQAPRSSPMGLVAESWRPRLLTAGEVFDAYCTVIDSGDPISSEYNVGKIRYGSRGFDPYRRPTKVQVKDGEPATPCRMLHYSPLTDSPFSDSPYRGY
jgi:hypothetical protein